MRRTLQDKQEVQGVTDPLWSDALENRVSTHTCRNTHMRLKHTQLKGKHISTLICSDLATEQHLNAN